MTASSGLSPTLVTGCRIKSVKNILRKEVLSWRGLVTYFVLFFLYLNVVLVTDYVLLFVHLKSRRVHIAGITRHPDQEWMEQIGRSATQETWGYHHPRRHLLHGRHTEF